MLTCNVGLLSGVGKWALISIRHPHIPRPWNPIRANLQGVARLILSQSSIFGQNPKIGCQEFNDLQTPKLSKKQLCDRTVGGGRTGSPARLVRRAAHRALGIPAPAAVAGDESARRAAFDQAL